MIRVGLTGGIGSGKSTAATALADLGAVVVDADRLAREVLEPGSEGLAEVAVRFGDGVLAADGSLDRPALGAVVFGDEQARRDLEGITHPRIAALTRERFAAAADDAVVVHDVPLLVEKHMGPGYHLVVVVDTDEQTRLDRLVRLRGMDEGDARRRLAAQASDDRRRAAADVLLDNRGVPEALVAAVGDLWRTRLLPYEANVRTGTRARHPEHLVLAPPDPTWAAQGARLSARLAHLGGDVVQRVDHIGSTAVPGLLAKDVIDLQVGVSTLADADHPDFVAAMAAGGFPRVGDVAEDNAKDGTVWAKRFHGSMDPGRVAHVHVREVGSPGWRWALACRDWLRSDAGAREEYARLKTGLAADVLRSRDYAVAKEPWFDAAADRVEAWVAATRWEPPGRG